MPAGKAIGLFGGTFDPVHNGHKAVVRSYLDSGFIDELWILLTPDPPHKAGQQLSSYQRRKEMLRAAFREVDRVVISDVETRLPRPSYTIQTILHLKDSFSSYRFYLCIGEDSLINFETWFRWNEILEHCELLVAARPESHVKNMRDQIMKHTHFVDHEPVAVSSSGLREKLNRGEDISGFVPEDVCKIIQKYNLYCK